MCKVKTIEKAGELLKELTTKLNNELSNWRVWSRENIEVPTGKIIITDGVNDIMINTEGLEYIRKCLARHFYGDFGDIDSVEDWKANIISVWSNKGRVLSRYSGHDRAEDIYIITEGLGSEELHTTLMLVSEY